MSTKPSANAFYAPIERDLTDKVPDSEAAKTDVDVLAWLALAFLVEMGLIGWAVWHICKHRGML
jgi:hypothetical protein